MIYLLAGLGAAIGAILRYTISLWQPQWHFYKGKELFPIATLMINLSGSLLLGFISAKQLAQPLQFFFATGVCGGFTTFSTFNKELFTLLRRRDYLSFSAYILLSYLGGFCAVVLGFIMGSK